MKTNQNIKKQIDGSQSNPNVYDGKPMCCKVYESAMHFIKDYLHKDPSACYRIRAFWCNSFHFHS